MYMCPTPNCFRDRAVSLYSSKIVDKKEILRTVSNTGIYCPSDRVGTVYLVQYFLENSTVNINALCNSCVARLYSVLYSEIALSRNPFGVGHTYMYNFLFRMTDTLTSQNIYLSSWDTLYDFDTEDIVK
jgi:hypothetical protein